MIPKKIWLLWLQGEQQAPPLVRCCLEQWRQKNPGWQVILLDRRNLEQFIQLQLPPSRLSKLTSQHQSDLIRLALLEQHGGVWADATTFCMIPLDQWLANVLDSGCFLFSRPGKDRLIANWFMAAIPNHYLISCWHRFLSSYWLENPFEPLNFWQRQLVSILDLFLSANCHLTQYWFSSIVTKGLKVYPYYSSHYAFFYLVNNDPRANALWQAMPRLSANPPLRLVRQNLFSKVTAATQAELQSDPQPLYKLTWKHPKLAAYFANPNHYQDSVLHYLIQQFQHQSIEKG